MRFPFRCRKVLTILGLVMATALAAALLFPSTADAAITTKKQVGDKEIKVTAYGFMQYEARAGKGFGEKDGLRFQAQRVRLGTNFFVGKVFGKLFLDFNQDHLAEDAGLPKMIKDGFAGYKWSDSAFIKIGMMKTPLGMSFTIPGWNLDNIERNGLDKGLVLERDFGVMLSGRLIGGPADQKVKTNGTEMGHERWGDGFGYDIGVFNPAGRSSAVNWDDGVAMGDALAYVGRIHYDWNGTVHLEAAYAVNEKAGGNAYYRTEDPDLEDYEVFDLGVNAFLMDNKINIKGEFISGENIRGETGRDQQCLTLTFGYMLTDQIEGLVKHYAASADRGGVSTDLGNTYLGINFYLEPLDLKPRTLQNHKIVLNYVITSGDDDGTWNGLSGYQDEVYMMQYQYKF